MADIDVLEERVRRIEEQQKQDYDSRSKIHEEINAMKVENTTKYVSIETNQGEIMKQLGKLEAKQDALSNQFNELASKPAKRYESLVSAVVTGIVTLIIGSILTAVLFNIGLT